MARLSAKLLRKRRSQLNTRESQQKLALQGAILALTAAAAVVTVAAPLPKTPVRTSILTGQLWLEELFRSPVRMYEQLGMAKHVFRKLVKELCAQHGLSSSKYVSADEKVAIFLHFARTGASSRMLQERFQRSGETISKYLRQITKMLIGSFYRRYVKPLPLNEVPFAIRNEPKFFPYFKDCRGTTDGSQFNSWVEEQATIRCRNRKGFISQNVLAVCDWGLRFLYILSGWEGSAADSRIFEYARARDLRLPRPYYFLADAGFPLCDMLMTPYRGVRYHLKEWGRGTQKPQNHEELFNLRHASARNAVERIFGVFKREFGVFKTAPEYPMDMQTMFVPALGAIHNFNDIHDRNAQRMRRDMGLPTASGSQDSILSHNSETAAPNEPRIVTEEELGFTITAEERVRSTDRRDQIAKRMWVDYQAELRRRGE